MLVLVAAALLTACCGCAAAYRCYPCGCVPYQYCPDPPLPYTAYSACHCPTPIGGTRTVPAPVAGPFVPEPDQR